MYAHDNNDRLVRNYDIGNFPQTQGDLFNFEMFASANGGASSVAGDLDYDGSNSDNTNTALLVTRGCAAFARYIQTAATYKCPDDASVVAIGSATLPRVRSCNLAVPGPPWDFGLAKSRVLVVHPRLDTRERAWRRSTAGARELGLGSPRPCSHYLEFGPARAGLGARNHKAVQAFS